MLGQVSYLLFKSKSSQLILLYINTFILSSEFYHHFQTHSANPIDRNDDSKNKDTSSIERLDANTIREIAENALESKGFVYDSNTELYYDTQNALYYDQVNCKL
jgi:hypothetical protein